MTHHHISVDLETFGKGPDAAIAAIGAVVFNPHGEPPPQPFPSEALSTGYALTPDMFYINVAADVGSLDPDTFRWWLQQEDAARHVLLAEPQPTETALRQFSRWLAYWVAREPEVGSADPESFPEGVLSIWAHATFDPVILDSAFTATGVPRPWHRRDVFDLRTTYLLTGGRPDLRELGGEHNALWDAWRQAQEVQQCYRQLRAMTAPSDHAAQRAT